jgi:hypothetical protein
VEFKLPQIVRDEAALVRITIALSFWGKQCLSQAARILISNQIILACIWYLASCTDLCHIVLIRFKALVKDFFWSGCHNHQARAKVAWKTTIQPVAMDAVKLLDPVLQACSLLTKLLICSLAPSPEPWKSFLLHRLRSICLVRQGT